MSTYQSYHQLYPYLPIEAAFFFSEVVNGQFGNRTVFDFCMYYAEKYKSREIPQPGPVSAICDILCQQGQLTLGHRRGLDNTDTSYISVIRDRENVVKNIPLQLVLNNRLSCLIYGFKYIYENYGKYVLPVEFTKQNDDIALGSCFMYKGGIATARHCIEGAKKIAIRGITQVQLETAKYQVHSNNAMDLIFIHFDESLTDFIYYGEKAEVLDEVIAMGYPRIPGYHNFLTAETATVSARFTASVGQIAAEAEDFWIKEQLFLITAKIKGGNSGGPIIKKNGTAAGVSVNLAHGDGDYDDLGYGTVIPVAFLDEMIVLDEKHYLDVGDIIFKDFE